ncbi:MAG TPA: TonB-dependent receptor [Povalibacter sp.]|uniref:TonB-dependent receptor n=1 Tax=Povalibacter sp. TaxID=1962978 RepID=UPI002CF3C372|nr:TonB-dependent receptor [Povalibacter sp.]HMN43031.1 TonB-dependent receptor [Povalibacter sp.]
MRRHKWHMGWVTVCGGVLAQTVAVAADGPAATLQSTQLEEVIVTAQKRSEDLQDVPIAVKTLSVDDLIQGGTADVTGLTELVPGLNIINANGILNTSLRGIGSNAVAPGFENPVALYVDGVYYASATANYLNLANISQVAVVKGPQGTLYGRNATGGLLQVTTRDPRDGYQMQASVSYGNYDTSAATVYIGGRTSDYVAADISVYAARQGEPWGDNLSTGGEIYTLDHDVTVRSKWVFTPSDATTITLIGDYSDIDTSMNVPTIQPGTISGFTPGLGVSPDLDYDVADDAPNWKKGHSAGGSLLIRHDFDSISISSLTAYRESEYKRSFELDGGPLPLVYAEDTWPDSQFSEELQIQSLGDSALTWQAGVYYFEGKAAFTPITLFGNYLGANLTFFNRQSTESIAGYAQGSYAFSDSTTLTLGARYTEETRKAYDGSSSVYVIPFALQLPTVYADDEKATFDKFNYRVSLDHRFSDTFLAYISSSSGFKSGGFNTGSPGTAPYDPETVTAYEIGTKADLAGRSVRWNNAAYYYDYKDLQTQVLDTSGVIYIANAASADIYGFESDLDWQATDALRLSGGVSFIKSEYSSYIGALLSDPMGGVPSTVDPTGTAVKGNALPYAPEFTATLGADYTWSLPAGTIKLAVNGYYNDGFYFEADNVMEQDSYVDLAANLRWTSNSGRFWISAYGKNLLDERTIGYATTQSNGTHLLQWAAPLTYGVAVGVSLD